MNDQKPSKKQIPKKQLYIVKSLADKITSSGKTQYIIIFALCVLFYGNSIKNNYSLDDKFVTNNEEVKKGFKVIPHFFNSTYANVVEDGKQVIFGYRPVVKASFAIESQLFGTNPHVSHFVNVLIYFLTCLLLFILLRKLLFDYHPLLPLLITIVFLVHPVHTEVVSSLKNRDEMLCFLFSLIALYFSIRYIDSNKLYFVLLAMVSFGLGRLSKISVITWVVAIPLIIFYFKKPSWKKITIISFSMAFILILAKIISVMATPPFHKAKFFIENPLVFDHSIFSRISAGMVILLYYIKLQILPHPLLFYYGYNMIPILGWSNILVYVSLLFHLFLLVFSIYIFKKNRILSFGILYYLITISAYSNILNPPSGIIADRFLFSPLLGFCFIIAFLLFKFSKVDMLSKTLTVEQSKKILIITFVLLIPYFIKTITRNQAWKDQMTLMEADMPHLENSAKANYIYAGTLKTTAVDEYKKTGNSEKASQMLNLAIFHAQRATQIYHPYYQAYNMIGNIYSEMFHQKDSAEKYFLKTLEANSLYGPAYFNLGIIQFSRGDTNKGISYLKKSIDLNPSSPKPYFVLADLYQKQGNKEQYEYYLQQGQNPPKQKKGKKRRKGNRILKNLLQQE